MPPSSALCAMHHTSIPIDESIGALDTHLICPTKCRQPATRQRRQQRTIRLSLDVNLASKGRILLWSAWAQEAVAL